MKTEESKIEGDEDIVVECLGKIANEIDQDIYTCMGLGSRASCRKDPRSIWRQGIEKKTCLQ